MCLFWELVCPSSFIEKSCECGSNQWHKISPVKVFFKKKSFYGNVSNSELSNQSYWLGNNLILYCTWSLLLWVSKLMLNTHFLPWSLVRSPTHEGYFLKCLYIKASYQFCHRAKLYIRSYVIVTYYWQYN